VLLLHLRFGWSLDARRHFSFLFYMPRRTDRYVKGTKIKNTVINKRTRGTEPPHSTTWMHVSTERIENTATAVPSSFIS